MILRRTQPVNPSRLDVKVNTIINLIGCLTYQGCLWATTVLVVLLSGYDASGTFAYAMAIGNIFFAIATFSARVYQVSDTDNRFSSGTYLVFRAFTIVVGFFLIIPYLLITTSDISLIPPVIIFLLFKLDESFCDVLYAIDQKNERMDYIGFSQFVRGILVVAFFCLGLLIGKSLSVAFSAMFCTCFFFTLSYDLSRARRFGDINLTITPQDIVALIKACFPVMLSSTLIGAVVSLARQFFGNQFGVTELGYYAAVATPAVLVQAAARYLYAPALVPLASKWRSGDLKEFNRLLSRTYLLILISAIVATAFIILITPVVFPRIYGPEIEPYTNVLLISGILMGTNCIAFVSFSTDTLIVCRDIKGCLISVTIGFLACLISSVPLENTLKMHGINVTVILSMLIILTLCFIRILSAIRSQRESYQKGR